MPSQSQQQQKLFGLALSVKRGETARSEASKEVLDIVDSMTEKQIEDFAGTEHSGLPTKVESQLRDAVREIMRERTLSESVNEVQVADFEIGDFVHFKRLNKTGMVTKISGNKVTIRTPQRLITGDIKDIEVLYQDGITSSINEKQLKGLDGIPSTKKLKDLTDEQKLKIIQSPGNIIDFKVPDYLKGKRNFYQVISKGKIIKKKNISGDTIFFVAGGGLINSPTYSSVKELINNVLWDSMEDVRKFNEGSTKHIDSLTEKLPNDFATIPNNGQVNGALKHLQHHTDVISKNVKAGKGVYKKDLMKMANIIKALQMYEGINESSVEIGDNVFFPSANSAATVVDRFGRSVTLKLANGKKVKTVVDKIKLLAQDNINEHNDCGCGCNGVTEGGCGTSIKEEKLNEWRAEEVLQQLGGRKFIAMTGAKNFVKDDKAKSITFKIPRAKDGITHVMITLNSSDTYTINFLSIRGNNIKQKPVKGVYNDQLQSVFTQYTGLYTSL